MAISLLNAGPATVVAEQSDLQYRLVTPGEWAWVVAPAGLTNFDITEILQVEDHGDSVEWGITYTSTETGMSSAIVESSPDPLTLVFSIVDGDDEYRVEISRPSLPGHLLDRAVNAVSASSAITLKLPAAESGKARDFHVRLTVSASSAITFSAQTGETVTWDAMGNPSSTFAAGTYLYRITEVAAGVMHAEDMFALVGLETALEAINGGTAS